MKKIRPGNYLTAIMLCVFLVWAMLVVCGCDEQPANKRNVTKSKLGPTIPDDDFARGANRPPTTKTLYAMAKILISQGKDKQAEVLLRQIIKEQPGFMVVRNQLAGLLMRQRRVNEAIITISEGLVISPQDPVLLNNLGMCRLIKREYIQSLEKFTEAAGIQPENTRYRANMALTLLFLGRDDEALSLYKQILPEDQALHNIEVIKSSQEKMVSQP